MIPIFGITIASNAVPADDGDFGSANLVLTFDGSDPQRLRVGLDAARRSFGSIEVIGHRSVPVPGDVEKVDYRSQVPDGAYSGDLLALRRGSYPTGPGQVAVTAAIGSITIASNAAPADDSDFGSADLVLTFDGSDRQRLQAGLDAAVSRSAERRPVGEHRHRRSAAASSDSGPGGATVWSTT